MVASNTGLIASAKFEENKTKIKRAEAIRKLRKVLHDIFICYHSQKPIPPELYDEKRIAENDLEYNCK